jgi:hypothetical protein
MAIPYPSVALREPEWIATSDDAAIGLLAWTRGIDFATAERCWALMGQPSKEHFRRGAAMALAGRNGTA